MRVLSGESSTSSSAEEPSPLPSPGVPGEGASSAHPNPYSLHRLLLGIAIAYVSWLAFMAVHELGHILHAVISGGRVILVSVPLRGFSQTIVHPDPHELFVVWGGPLWGVLIPLMICGVFSVARRRVPDLWRFFTGLCLIANGAYVGLGWRFGGGGDGKDMPRLGTPRLVMIGFGVICVTVGLLFWHRTRGLSVLGRDRVYTRRESR